MKIFKGKFNDERVNYEIYKASFIALILINSALLIDFVIKSLILNRPLNEWLDVLIIFIIGSICLTICLIKSGVLKTMLSESKSNVRGKRVFVSLISAIFVSVMINLTDGYNFYSKKGLLNFCFDFVAFFIIMYIPFGAMRRLFHPEK
ncbi:DUF6773 family protein [Clostridium hydrogenum]|uniref:DUF6773 family protein n=1 Tax=Clostridium hydrogenum TaxID=2855764 RepID=UPI001F24D3DC|nr:DUF6773 family protein [Clostridium hydrogenum]